MYSQNERFYFLDDEIEIDEMEYDPSLETYFYPCPCGDRFQISLEELLDGEEVAKCPSCSLTIRVIYSPSDLDGMDSDFSDLSDSEDDEI